MADQSSSAPVQSAATGIANPAPLGLCAFALTTFVLSAANAKLYEGDKIVMGLALFYGGLAQVLAGMWEFRTGNTFGATAFTSYGAFWMSVWASLQFNLIAGPAAFGVFLMGWTIFTGLMVIASARSSVALIVLFVCLFVTFLLLTMAQFGHPTGQLGGYLGIVTAVIAWYNALAGLLSAGKSAMRLPIGNLS